MKFLMERRQGVKQNVIDSKRQEVLRVAREVVELHNLVEENFPLEPPTNPESLFDSFFYKENPAKVPAFDAAVKQRDEKIDLFAKLYLEVCALDPEFEKVVKSYNRECNSEEFHLEGDNCKLFHIALGIGEYANALKDKKPKKTAQKMGLEFVKRQHAIDNQMSD